VIGYPPTIRPIGAVQNQQFLGVDLSGLNQAVGQLQQQMGQLGQLPAAVQQQLQQQAEALGQQLQALGSLPGQVGAQVQGLQQQLDGILHALSTPPGPPNLPPKVTAENPFTALASGWASAWPWLIAATVLAVGVGVVERFDPRAATAIAGVTFAAAALAHPNVLQDLNDLLSTGSSALQNATTGTMPSSAGGTPPGGFGAALPSSAGPIAFAQRMVAAGVPYTWGGTSPSTGFDCSGLVQWAFAQVGKALPRTTQTQWAAGQPVQPVQLQPGDVVFFQGTDGPGITHDGIYIGGGQFIHASDPATGLTTSSLTSAYWASHYAGARRY
jgi:cell wall-associated NlpC family hydrolase